MRYGARAKSPENLLDLYERTRGEGFGREVKRRIMLGAFALSAGYKDAYYKRALGVRDLIAREYETCFEKCDVILSPTSPQTAFELGGKTDPLAMYLCDIYTIGANLAGIPAVSLPCGFDKTGLPIGVQLQGRYGADIDLLRAALLCEDASLAARKPAMLS